MVNENRALKAGGLLLTPGPMKMETALGRGLINEASVSEAVPMPVLPPKPAAISRTGERRPLCHERSFSSVGSEHIFLRHSLLSSRAGRIPMERCLAAIMLADVVGYAHPFGACHLKCRPSLWREPWTSKQHLKEFDP